MADPNHVELVLTGADAVRAWRSDQGQVRLDLSGAALVGLELPAVPIRPADFHGSDLTGADLREADLEGADFRWATLSRTNFSGARLVGADFHKARLAKAILRRANLTSANFEDADLEGAILDAAIIGQTRLLDTDLSKAVGLSTISHAAPSLINESTLKTSGELPIEFLRGCGLYAARQAFVYRVFIASPSDVQQERQQARRVIYEWNDHNSENEQVILLPVMWETHSRATLELPAQELIDRELLEGCQILVCIFWGKVGTPTPQAESGTLEEFQRCVDSGKPVMVYFSRQPNPPDVESANIAALERVRQKIYKMGLAYSYDTLGEFEDKLGRHLTQTVRRLRKEGIAGG